jgi:hypothetical protein
MRAVDKGTRDECLKTMFEGLSAENQSYILGKVEGLREAQRRLEGSRGATAGRG